MTNEELGRLEALANAATPGPWLGDDAVNGRHGAPRVWDAQNYDDLASFTEYHGLGGENAAYVAAASPYAVLRLVAELREARDQRDAATLKSKNVTNDALRMMGEMTRIEVILGTVDDETVDVVASVRESVEERNALRAELSEARAEIARLRAMVPSESTTRLVRQWYDQAVIALASIGHLLDDREAAGKQLATAGEWLARIESAKEKEYG